MPDPIRITEPGVYDLSEADYHADPVPGGSLSSTGARKLLPPSCPAKFRYEQDNGQPFKREFEIGHAAHQRVLGAGPDLVVVDRERWDTNAVKAEVAAIRAAGNVPLKRAEYEQVEAMAAALRENPIVRALFNADSGRPEQSLFWVDQVWRRARLDWLPERRGMGRVILADYKSCADAATDAVSKSIYNYGYHVQAAWYLDGAQRLGLAGEDAAFLFVFQEKTPPYLVNVVQPDAMALRIGRSLNREAVDIYRRCRMTDVWPGYADDVQLVGLPAWAENRYLEEMSS